MKKHLLVLYTALVLLAGTACLHSQWPAVPVKSPMDSLKALKAANADLIEQQKKTLDTLDDISAAADQIRIKGKRT
jgi:hypothetical protein